MQGVTLLKSFAILLDECQVWQRGMDGVGVQGSTGTSARCSASFPHLRLHTFPKLPLTTQICDSDSQFIKRSDCDTIFIVCNFQVGGAGLLTKEIYDMFTLPFC